MSQLLKVDLNFMHLHNMTVDKLTAMGNIKLVVVIKLVDCAISQIFESIKFNTIEILNSFTKKIIIIVNMPNYY